MTARTAAAAPTAGGLSTAVPTGGPAAPDAALPALGAAVRTLADYAALLAGAGVQRGLLGPREAPRLWERHLLNCVGLAELVPPAASVADLGSGAGLPGLVLAALRPDCHLVLVEPLLRRATFLDEAVGVLGLGNVEVRRARGEQLHGELVVDAVVARAVAPLDRLAGWSLPLLRPGGRLLALKGASAEREIAAAAAGLRRAGAAARIMAVGSPALLTAARVVVVEPGSGPRGTR